MLAEGLLTRREPAEVHDAPNPRPPRCFAKVAGGRAIRFTVVAVRPHRVHQVIGHVDACEGAIERRRVEEIPRDHVRRRRHARRERGRMPRETAEPHTRALEDGHQPSPDVAGCASDEHEWGFRRRRLSQRHGSLRRTGWSGPAATGCLSARDVRSPFSSSARDWSNTP